MRPVLLDMADNYAGDTPGDLWCWQGILRSHARRHQETEHGPLHLWADEVAETARRKEQEKRREQSMATQS